MAEMPLPNTAQPHLLTAAGGTMWSCSPVATCRRRQAAQLPSAPHPCACPCSTAHRKRRGAAVLTRSGMPASATAASSCARSREWMPPRARATCTGQGRWKALCRDAGVQPSPARPSSLLPSGPACHRAMTRPTCSQGHLNHSPPPGPHPSPAHAAGGGTGPAGRGRWRQGRPTPAGWPPPPLRGAAACRGGGQAQRGGSA